MKKRLIMASLAFSLFTQGLAFAEGTTPPQVNWVEGGKVVELGKIATIDLGQDFLFLNGEDTKKVIEANNDIPSGNEIGSVCASAEDQNWSVLFDYEESGHIKDDEKGSIDADGILQSITEGTEADNEKKTAEDRIFVKGWDIKPFYDEKTHNLTWSILAEDTKKEKLINYNVRLLTRTGVMSITLISDPKNFAHDKQIFTEQILPKVSVKAGQRYEEFDASKDKLAEYGLSALILGGAGVAVAKKVGILAGLLVFLKKGWVIIAAIIAGIWKFRKGKGKKNKIESNEPSPDFTPDPPDEQKKNIM